MTAFATKNVKVASMGIALQSFLNLDRQAVHAAPHVGVADRQPHPHAGDLYVFRGKSGHLIKVLWHDGIGMSLYAKRLERGRFIWPSPADGVVTISPAQLGYLLEGLQEYPVW